MANTAQDSRQVWIGPRKLRFLEDLLWEWVAIQERSIRMWKGDDALWWYGERASVGGFAGAVWRCGGIVLEEYSTDKLDGEGTMAKIIKTKIGRGDMDFLLGGKQFTIEAKQCWPRMDINWVKKALDKAENDLKRRTVIGNHIRLAVVFASLSLSGRGKEANIPECINEWIQQSRNLKDCAHAWAFPSSGQKLKCDHNTRFYPGGGVFVKQVCT